MIAIKSVLRVTATTLIVLAPALGAQERADVFGAPYRRNVFSVMQLGRTALTGSFHAELANNTLSVSDAWAINEIAPDLRLSDIFLVGGLIPEGAGMRMSARTGVQGTISFPVQRGAIALVSGVRALGQSHMPDEVATFARNGFTGDSIFVPLNGLSASTMQFADAGVVGLIEVTKADARTRVRLGAGVHALYGIGTSAITFGGSSPSYIAMSRTDSVTAEVTMRSPLQFAQGGGSGVSFDAYAGVDFGNAVSLSAVMIGVGSIEVASGSEEVRRLSMRGTAFDFVEEMESIAPDTVPSSAVRAALPAIARVEGSFRLLENTRAGVQIQRELSTRYAAEPTMVTALMHYDLRQWLPFHVGASGGSRYGLNPFIGSGLHFKHLRMDGELGFRGGSSPADLRGFNLRSSMSILF